jgi:asparagine synthase (glutamine-hydrolysing)
MCGIFGILTFGKNEIDLNGIKKAVDSISHRGPDDDGFAFFNTGQKTYEERYGEGSLIKKGNHLLHTSSSQFNLAFGFRRLSILDLTINGHQPFFNPDKNVCLIFNGEIYNFIEIKNELRSKGYPFSTECDTEVIMNSYLEWGEDCLSKFNGMWAIAIYDMRKNVLFCSRDRFGVKPFYYLKTERHFVFSSELKSILSYFDDDPFFKKILNDKIVYDYLYNNYVDHTDDTFIKDIKHLSPSHFITINSSGDLKKKKYFSIEVNEELGKYDESKFSVIQKDISELLHDAVKLRLRSDVPLGTCLSGGLDSSSIVTIINDLLTGEMEIERSGVGQIQKSFSAVYDDPNIDEKKYIDEVVKHTNCDPYFTYPDKSNFIDDIDQFIYQLDEPMTGTSPYAQYNVMRLVREKNVTVVLDGQGADESFAGYEVYFGFLYNNLLKKKRYSNLANEIFKNFRKGVEISARGFKYFVQLKNKKRTADEFYNKDFLNRFRNDNILEYRSSDNLNKVLYEDLTKYILPSLLRYEDRNSMAFSIESRTPFLDYRIINYLFSTEAIYKIHDGWSKWILRNSMKDQLPQTITWRKDKKGFPTPERKWLLKLKGDFEESLMGNKNLMSKFIDAENVINNFDMIISDKKIKSHFLWKIYNLSKWTARNKIDIE